MEALMLPSKISLIPGENDRMATLVVEPCEHGYGTTIGNALRRVLLSSLPGAAVVAVKIKGSQHEFAGVDGVKEDVLEIVLNLKQLRVRVHADEPVRLSLTAKGERAVTAADIEANSDVEIVNPELHIATLTEKKSDFEMEIFVAKGRGYMPIEERSKEKHELGVIAVDALFAPVREVGFKVENVRVGQITNFDKLTMSIETDGTITPAEAVSSAVKIVADHFALIAESLGGSAMGDGEVTAEETEEATEEEKPKKKTAKKK
jgi:DNA-directed RNA polymerase subunit alpha